MATQSNTIHIVIDPSGAIAGANATNGAINSIITNVNGLNITMNNFSNTVNSATRNSASFFSRFGLGLSTLAGAFTLDAIIGSVRSFVDEISRVDRIYNGFIAMMTVTTKDVAKSRLEYKYIAETARIYGVSLESLIKSYAKLAAATNGLMSENQTKRLFESFTAVSSVLHADQITVERMFNAIIQMASKGQVHMEELKQQLGEHLPGALAIAALALDMTMGDMIKAMSKGEISAKQLLVPLPQILMDKFGEAAKITALSLNATFMNLKTSMFDAFKEMSTNGVALGLSEVLRAVQTHVDTGSESFAIFGEIVGAALLDLANFIRALSPEQVAEFTRETLNLIKSLVELIRSFFDAAVAVSTYRSEIWLAIQLYIDYRLYVIAAAGATAIYTAAMASATLGTSALALAIAALSYAFNVLISFVAGWQIGTYLKNEFLVAEQAGIALAAGLTKLPVRIAGAFQAMGIKIKLFLTEAFQSGLNSIFQFIADVKNIGGAAARMLGFDVANTKPLMTFDFAKPMRKELAQVNAQTAAEIAKIDDIYQGLFDDAGKRHADKDSKSVMDRLGLNKKSFEDAGDLIANFNKLKEEAEKIEGKKPKGGDKGPSGYTIDVDRADQIMAQYKIAFETYRGFQEAGDMSTQQMIASQIKSLEDHTAVAVKVLESAKAAASAKDKHKLDDKVEMLNRAKDSGVAKLQADGIREARKYEDELQKIELDSGSKRLNNQEKFLAKWRENAKMMTEALQNGDTDAVARLMESFQSGLKSAWFQDNADNLRAGQTGRDELLTQDKTQNRTLASIGVGDKTRSLNTGLNQINDKYDSQRQELENQKELSQLEGSFNGDSEKLYNDKLGLIDRFQKASISSYTEYYGKLTAQEGNWAAGFNEGIQNYMSSSGDMFSQTGKIVSDAFKGMEDALTNFVMTGKLDFNDFANSIVADITRMIIKQQIMNALQSSMGGGGGDALSFIGSAVGMLGGTGGIADVASSLPGDSMTNMLALTDNFSGRANGGFVAANDMYEVNERGPELLAVGGRQYLMMGDKPGHVTPNEKLSKSTNDRPVVVNNSFTATPSNSRESQTQLAHSAGLGVRRALQRNG